MVINIYDKDEFVMKSFTTLVGLLGYVTRGKLDKRTRVSDWVGDKIWGYEWLLGNIYLS